MNELYKDIEALEQVCKKISDGNIVGAQIQLLQMVQMKEAEFAKAEKAMEAEAA